MTQLAEQINDLLRQYADANCIFRVGDTVRVKADGYFAGGRCDYTITGIGISANGMSMPSVWYVTSPHTHGDIHLNNQNNFERA